MAELVNLMTRLQVTFKGEFYDITVSGESAEEVVEEYKRASRTLETALKSKVFKDKSDGGHVRGPKPLPLDSEVKTLEQLSIPAQVKSRVVEQMNRLSNWEVTFILLHYAPKGLTNKQIRSLSEELGKPISYSWFDTEFHRRTKEGLVISRRPAGSRETKYLLAEPGKRRARTLVEEFNATPQQPE